jgi:hypothetical protein
MDETAARFWSDLMARPNGPFGFRFLLQPAVAIFYAFRDGRRDAKNSRPAYFWAIFKHPEHRRELIKSGWKSVGKVFILALIIDLIYQVIAMQTFRPLETVVVAVVLALVPYILVRGPINRLLN